MALDWTRLLSLIGPLSIFVVMIVMAVLSKRLGSVTHAAPYYIGFYIAALLVGISIVFRVVNGDGGTTDFVAVLIYTALPALSVTLGVIIAWRYWSWLFAERS